MGNRGNPASIAKYQFKPGQSGNPNGRPKGFMLASTVARGYADEAFENLVRLSKGTGTPAVQACTLILEYSYGKPVESLVLMQADVGAQQKQDVPKLSNKELADKAVHLAEMLREMEDEAVVVDARLSDT